MPVLLVLTKFLIGLVMLLVGGQFLVNGSVKIAKQFGMSPLLIGLTLVAFGTSAPELVTSIQASLSGSPGIAIGNVVGSNIANLLVILGLSALICPIPVSDKVLRRDSLIMLAVAILFVAVSFFMPLGRIAGSIFILLLAGYIFYGWWTESREAAPGTTRVWAIYNGLLTHSSIVIAGLALLTWGGSLFVDAASGVARLFGISETVIGLTVVAIGTSAPELFTSVMAVFKKEPDIAIGNVVGSNIYNILGIAGITGIIAPLAVLPIEIFINNFVMLGATLLALIFFWSKKSLMRHEGFIMLVAYAAYVSWLLSG